MKQTPSFPWLEGLNPQQLAAVTHQDGPLLVVAGAGSGKTRTLAYRVAYLMATGVPSERILLLTFTRRSAEEMTRRAAEVIQESSASISRVWGGTFHATASRLLRMYAHSAGLDSDFTIIDQSDAQDMLNVLRHERGLSKKEKRFPRKSTCLNIYSRRMGSLEPLERILKRHYPWCEEHADELKQLFRTYVERKQEQMVLDYDDLMLYLANLLKDDEVSRHIGERFDHVLVDEYQDTNALQAQILQGLRRYNQNVMAVGDDAQSIYGFRAATVRNMLDFPEHFPGARIIKLEQNYRSVVPILEATNRVIDQATERFTKNLWSERTEGERPKLVLCPTQSEQDQFIIQEILKHYESGIPLQKQAVLFRAGHHADSLEVELTRHNLPYRKYGGLRFLEAAHVKDLICLLRLAENPRDEFSWFRILQLITGIGPVTASKAIAHLKEHRCEPRALAEFQAPPPAREPFANLSALIQGLHNQGQQEPATQVEQFRRFYDPLMAKTYENPQQRKHDLEHLEQIATNYRSRQQFLAELILDPPRSTGDLAGTPDIDEDWVELSTIHSAKGCEWDVVFLIHAADGNLPSDMATGDPEQLEEELRLTYVALTRARDYLYVTWPLRYYHKKHRYGDAYSYAQLCRFIDHPRVKEMFDQFAVAGATHQIQDSPTQLGRRLDIASSARDMWS